MHCERFIRPGCWQPRDRPVGEDTGDAESSGTANYALLYHLVGSDEHNRREGNPEGIGGLLI
jgi:hypothetical protein